MQFSTYLQSTFFLDYDSVPVRRFIKEQCDMDADARTKAVQLYYGVRDTIRYDPYDVREEPTALMASSVALKGEGYCVAKAVLLTAAARGAGIPARLGFADVSNHLTTAKLRRLIGTNVFIYHGYTELFLDNRWIKATPAFNLSLCQKFGVLPLEFDGKNDSLFHPYDATNQRHMEYLKDHGHFPDLPFAQIFEAYKKRYPAMFAHGAKAAADYFAEEASDESAAGDFNSP
ncbi:MAG TPA: transglutaminase family protein [Desulfopila sp.]|nr:transglutaminase family protein [Desulfopila sp.]